MKKLILHVGAPKTGTSTIQGAFKRYREVEPRPEVHYPTDLDAGYTFPNRRHLSTGNGNVLAYALRQHVEPEAYTGFGLDDVLDDLMARAGSHETVLLSHEDLVYAPPEFLVELAEWADSHGVRIQIVLFIREQLQWHVSNYHQHVRQNAYDGDLDTLVDRAMSGCEWNRIAAKFCNAFGSCHLTVRLVARELMPRGIAAAFADVIGITSAFFEANPEADANVTAVAGTDATLVRFSDEAAARLRRHYHPGNVELAREFLTAQEAAALLGPE